MFPLYDFLIYCFITAYTPGANNILSMHHAARLGFKRSFTFNLGITLGFFIVMGVCTLFSSTLYTLLPLVKPVLQAVGALYLLYLALKIWKSPVHLETDKESRASLVSGMLLQFVNPKIYIYCITAMSLYILPVYSTPLPLAAFVLVLTAIGASGCFVWAIFGSTLSRLFLRYSKVVNLVMALLLVYCALSLFK